MTSLTEKAEDIIKDPHFMHSAGIGLSAMLLVGYMNKNQPEATSRSDCATRLQTKEYATHCRRGSHSSCLLLYEPIWAQFSA